MGRTSDAHLDLALSQFLSETWHVGVLGCAYYQLSADSYPTDGPAGTLRSQALGSFKSRVFAAGPQVGICSRWGPGMCGATRSPVPKTGSKAAQ